MILSKKLRWTTPLALTLVLVALSCSSNDNETPAPDPGDDEVPVTNEAPIFQNPPIGAIEVDEDITDQDVIVALKAEDPEGDEFTFSILEDDDALFEINQDGELSLLAGKQLNAEESDSHSVTVAVKDSNGNQATLKLTLTVLEAMALQDDPDAFLTTWSVGDNDKINLAVASDYDNYDYQVDWGDGSPVEFITEAMAVEHTYAIAGDYQVAIKGIFPAIIHGSAPGLNLEQTKENAEKLISIDQWGNNIWQSMSGAFRFCKNMVYNATDTPNLEEVTGMGSMFSGCSKFNGDIGNWDVSSVDRMQALFANAIAFNRDISDWNVGNVTDMIAMFTGATNFDQDLSAWGDKLDNVTNMGQMFEGASEFNQDLGNWKVDNVVSMSSMFENAVSFEGLGLEEWNVGNVTIMRNMFSGATAFDGDIEAWDTGKVTKMAQMFKDATAFDRSLGAWDLSSIEPGTDNNNDTESLEGMLDNSGLSKESFNATLIGWGNNDKTPDDIILGAEGVTWCGQDALIAKNVILQTEKGWDIQGDVYLGFACENFD